MTKWHINEFGQSEECSAVEAKDCNNIEGWKSYGHFDTAQAAKEFFDGRAARHVGDGGRKGRTAEELKALRLEREQNN